MATTGRRFVAGFLIWTALALLSASQGALRSDAANEPANWMQLVPSSLIDWYSCAIFTPFLFVAARRWPIESHNWTRHAPVHVALCALASVSKFAIGGTAAVLLLNASVVPLATRVQRGFISENIAFWCAAGIIHAIETQRRVSTREVQAAQLQARLSEAQLRALSAQLQPHFLFNTLQGISTLLYRDAKAADVMLRHLGTLLRRIIEAPSRHEVTLEEEMILVNEYLAIAHARFGDRLHIVREVEPRTLAGYVPQMVLQPLLENAFDHGIARRGGAGCVAICSALSGTQLRILVTNDGSALDNDFARDGIGLGATKARLVELYGADASLSIATVMPGKTTVALALPFHTAPLTRPAGEYL